MARRFDKTVIDRGRVIAAPVLIVMLIVTLYAQHRDKWNRPPTIDSFTSSSSKLVLPCPFVPFPTGCAVDGTCTMLLTVKASDADGDTLFFDYSVTGGHVSGKGAEARWTGLTVGSYEAIVTVRDRRGGSTKRTLSIEVVAYPCDPPCTTIALSCPENIEEGKRARIVATVNGLTRGLKPKYTWSTFPAGIISSKQANAIEIDTKQLAEHEVKVTVTIGGLDPTCNRESSCTFQIGKKSP